MNTNDEIAYLVKITKNGMQDVEAMRLSQKIHDELGFYPGVVRIAKLYLCYYPYHVVNSEMAQYIADSILHDCFFQYGGNELAINDKNLLNCASWILEAKKIGVTDDEGMIAQNAIELAVNHKIFEQRVFVQNIYFFDEELSLEQLHKITEKYLGNRLIYCFDYGLKYQKLVIKNSLPNFANIQKIETIDLNKPLSQLLALSNEALWMFTSDELECIRNYFNKDSEILERKKIGISLFPTDCEMEVIAQTWSEHCKHKEFAGIIHYIDITTGVCKTIDSLFDTYIRKATSIVQQQLHAWGANWLVKVFNDNAGLVRIGYNQLLAWKVETHNSPSALDPYGGALTGIVGVNRDPLGTGIGGAKLIFNTNVLCFASPDYSENIPLGLLHPKKIMEGVCKGIEDGGNKSGIPTVNGAVIFDDRFRGKPLVFCGTGGILQEYVGQKNNVEKNIQPDFMIFMAGGRVGSDGIHGATFSSVELNDASPRHAVQIGSPFTQKLLADFMIVANELNLLEGSTDNGAGGLSSSIGELAQISNGANVYLEKVPLKYAGLQPWEIFVSESQERMTLVVNPEKADAIVDLAKKFDVEITLIGHFTNSGYLDVYYNNKIICHLNLEFLHHGVPRKKLEAEWLGITFADFPSNLSLDYNKILIQILGTKNICSRERIIRRFDHEVQGKSILKPLMGMQGVAPQDAGVLRLGFDGWDGLAIACGICPKFSEFDAYAASAGAFDEGIRQIISVGGRLPTAEQPHVAWSINDNFCVPDSVYHPDDNPDGKRKMAQLVQMCEALFDMSTFFTVPLTSGKDSMKNDFRHNGVKISVPPTVLYSFAVSIADVRKVVSSEFKADGDFVYLVGKSYFEMAGTELASLLKMSAGQVPIVRMKQAKQIYTKMMKLHENNLLQSSHDLSDGGLLVALAESSFGGNMGVNISLDYTNIPLVGEAFGESHSRFIVSIRQQDKAQFEKIMKEDATLLGQTNSEKRFIVKYAHHEIINIDVNVLEQAWKQGLNL